MDILSKLEKISEKFIEGIFKNKVEGRLQPLEIAAQLYKEMKERKQVSLTKVYVPNQYKVLVSAEDWAEIEPLASTLAVELAAYLAQKAVEKEYYLTGTPVVVFEKTNELNPGEFKIEGIFWGEGLEPGETGQEVPSIERTHVFKGIINPPDQGLDSKAELVVLQGNDPGFAYRLKPGRMIIGRRSSNDIYLDDPKVSRQHAEITFEDGSFYLADKRSLNGTLVNGTGIGKKKLEPGDKITLGSTVIEFRVV